MKLNVCVVKTKSKKSIHAITCALEIDGKFSESISEEVADALIKTFNLEYKNSTPSVRLRDNTGIEDRIYN